MAAWDKDLDPAPAAAGRRPAWERDLDQAAVPSATTTPAQGSRARAQQASAGILSEVGGDLLAGIARGAGSIGATLLTPVDAAARALNSGKPVNVGGYDIAGQNRRAGMDQGLRELGADTDSLPFKGAKLATEIAGTLGVGGALAPVAKALGAAPSVVQAITTAGMRTGAAPATMLGRVGDLAVRSAGGAITGGVSAGMVNPTDAGSGAVVGALTPPVLKAAGGVARGAGKALRLTGGELTNLFKGDAARGADELMRALDLTPDQLPAVVAQLRGARTLVDGAVPTVAQALNKPQASILERVVGAGPGGEKLRQALVTQAEARMAALDRVAPVAAEGASQMRADTGTAIGRFAQAEESASSKAISKAYDSVDPNGQVRMLLPVDKMRAAAEKYLGPGTFGANADAGTAVRTAQALSKAPVPEVAQQPERWWRAAKQPAPPVEPRAATWQEVLNLRSSLGEAITKAKNAGDRQASAALSQMKGEIDSAIERVSLGGAQAGETFPAAAANQWREANASHAAKMGRFHNGPQGEIFRTVSGQPARQGGEVTGLFWGNRPGLAEDVQSFRKLVDENPAMLGQFRSMITTEGAATAAQGGALGARFVNWTRNMTPGLREAFSPGELQTIQAIAQDIERAGAAAKLGMGPGSNTYQNAANALDVGLLGSPLVKAVAQRTPIARYFAEPARAAMADSVVKAKGARLADLMSNAETAATALQGRQRGPVTSVARSFMDIGDAGLNSMIPGTGMTLRELMAASAYKTPPLLTAQ